MVHLVRLPTLLLLALFSLGCGRSFMSRSTTDFKMDIISVRQELDQALRGALGHGHGINIEQIKKMNTTLASVFQAMPKNDQNRVGAATMRYIVQRYFSGRHGWIIKGFEPHANRSTELYEDAGILESKVPGFIEASLEKELQHGGFALEDVLTMVIVVERLIFDEVIRAVQSSYLLNGVSPSHALGWDELMSVLESYLIVEMLERHTTNQEEHDEDRANILELYPNWPAARLFAEDIIGSETLAHRHSKNPFTMQGSHSFSFDDAARIAQRISNEYGLWGNQECVALRNELGDLDPHGTGRVPIADFYKAGDSGEWGFQESTEYLRQLGSLDESSASLGPQVIITNYAYGMSNCLSSTPYYSVCCLNACEDVLQQFEGRIANPSATPADILGIAESLISPKQVSASLRVKLEEVAAQHGGSVPLHGRLFAQWLHHVFPDKCAYPHAAGTVRPLTQSEWRAAGLEILVEESERASYLSNERNMTRIEPTAEDADMLWSFEEEVLAAPEPQRPLTQRSKSWHLLPGMAAICILVAVMRLQSGIAKVVIQKVSIPGKQLDQKSYLV